MTSAPDSPASILSTAATSAPDSIINISSPAATAPIDEQWGVVDKALFEAREVQHDDEFAPPISMRQYQLKSSNPFLLPLHERFENYPVAFRTTFALNLSNLTDKKNFVHPFDVYWVYVAEVLNWICVFSIVTILFVIIHFVVRMKNPHSHGYIRSLNEVGFSSVFQCWLPFAFFYTVVIIFLSIKTYKMMKKARINMSERYISFDFRISGSTSSKFTTFTHGKIVFELYNESHQRSTKNFRALCTGNQQNETFLRILEQLRQIPYKTWKGEFQTLLSIANSSPKTENSTIVKNPGSATKNPGALKKVENIFISNERSICIAEEHTVIGRMLAGMDMVTKFPKIADTNFTISIHKCKEILGDMDWRDEITNFSQMLVIAKGYLRIINEFLDIVKLAKKTVKY
jgi:cyclophilin family peptidyl-prolyl cis-trans isomerase